MKIGPKYKIARRLGAPVFEKTQTPKYTLFLQRKERTAKRRFSRPRTNFGIQLLEKQKVRYTYGLSEKQFSKYAKEVLSKKDENTTTRLFELLESRLDNIVFRIGFAPTRSAARQMVNHGHIMLNGKKLSFPSASVKEGDEISIRPRSASKPLFNDLPDRLSSIQVPSWISLDTKKQLAKIKSKPILDKGDVMFDLNIVLEFYSR